MYIYDTNTSFPHTLVGTISMSSMAAVTAIAYRAEDDSIYVLGSNEYGVYTQASNPGSGSFTRFTSSITLNSTSAAAGWAYDYRSDLFFNLDGNSGQIKVLNPQTGSMVTVSSFNDGFGAGSLYYNGELDVLGVCSGVSFFGLWNTREQRSIFGRVGSGVTAGGRDATFIGDALFIATQSSVLKVRLLPSEELQLDTIIATTQLTRTICADRTNNKIVCVCVNDGGGQDIHFKFINPVTATINSSPTIAVVSDERSTHSAVWCPFNNKIYCITRQITGGNPTRLIQADAATETIDGSMNLPANVGTSLTEVNNMICFNGIEL